MNKLYEEKLTTTCHPALPLLSVNACRVSLWPGVSTSYSCSRLGSQGSFWGDRGWAWGEPSDTEARQAYEALLRVSLLAPTSRGFTEFAEKVRQRALENYNYNFSHDEEVNFFIGAFYDGVVLLGMALNETLAEGGDITDGIAVTRRMWNREFEGEG